MLTEETFTPLNLRDGPEDNWPVFKIRAGSIIERDQFEGELEGKYRAGLVMPHMLLDAMERGVRALIPGNDADELIDLIRSEYTEPDSVAAEERSKVKAAGDILAEHWPDYAVLTEQEARRNAIMPTLAFLRWCDGWERVVGIDGEPVEFSRDARGSIPDEVTRRLSIGTIRTVGVRAYAFQYGRTQEKNLEPPSNSGPARKNSNSRASSKADGKSGASTSK